MTVLSASEARASLSEILNRVLDGHEVTITRRGQPVAVVVRPDPLRARRTDAVEPTLERLRDLLQEGGALLLRTRPRVRRARAPEIVAAINSSRHQR